jgi:outer membrane protein OmpA-like peptidoglycan-associated protein
LKKIVINTLLGLSATVALNAADCIMVKELNVEFKNASTVYSNASEYQEVKDYANFLSGAKYNYDLSTRRAAKVRETLISLGVNPSQVKSMGYGESTPLYDNSTEDGEAKNRRVRGEVFNSASELNEYITSEKNRIASIKYQEQ